MLRSLITFVFILQASSVAFSQKKNAPKKNPVQSDYYKVVSIPIPKSINLEAGGLELMPDGKLAVSTRRGDIYMVDKPFGDPTKVDFSLYASGLHEVLGLSYKKDGLYATQRGEVTRTVDTNKDGRADLFQTLSDGWGINGDYHEYAFGSKPDKKGNIWVVLCLTGSFTAQNKYRGWALQITPEGKVIPTTCGIRSPGGIGMNAAGDMFYTDNQGPWNGTCFLKHLKPGCFVGNPMGNKFFSLTKDFPKPPEPKSGSRLHLEEKKYPNFIPPAIAFPYNKMGKSASGIASDTTDNKFGPFNGQMFVGDQTHSTVMRVFMEKIDGVYQGACFPFVKGIGSGSLSLLMTKKGVMFVGGTNRGWGSTGSKPYSLDRIEWTGKVPFEVKEMKIAPDGFILEFTKPVDPKTAGDIKSYNMKTYTYIYQSAYGSPEVDHTTPKIQTAKVSADGKTVYLKIDKLQIGHVHELHLPGVRSKENLPVLHPSAYYQLNRIPKKK